MFKVKNALPQEIVRVTLVESKKDHYNLQNQSNFRSLLELTRTNKNQQELLIKAVRASFI